MHERLERIEKILLEHEKQISNITGADEKYKRYMKDLLSNLDDDNVPSLKFKITKGQMSAAIEAYANEAEAAIALTLQGYYTKANIDLYISGIESEISLAAQYAGTYTEVASIEQMTDKTKIYKYNNKFYRWNGSAWVETAQPPVSDSLASVTATANANEANLTLLTQTVTGHSTAIATIETETTANSSAISLVAQYTGQDEAITVATWSTSGKDTTKTYYATNTGLYYRYNGTIWVGSPSTSAASFVLAAINGESAAKIRADRIQFEGYVTFLTANDLGASGSTVIHGSRLDTNTVGTDTFKKRRDGSNIDWFDFYAGINMTAINVKATDYYPDTRQIIGLKSLRLYDDTNLISGHGGTSNTLFQTGQLSIGELDAATRSPAHVPGGGIMLSSALSGGTLGLCSTNYVEIISGNSAGNAGFMTLFAHDGSGAGTGYALQVTSVGIQAARYINGTITNSQILFQ